MNINNYFCKARLDELIDNGDVILNVTLLPCLSDGAYYYTIKEYNDDYATLDEWITTEDGDLNKTGGYMNATYNELKRMLKEV